MPLAAAKSICHTCTRVLGSKCYLEEDQGLSDPSISTGLRFLCICCSENLPGSCWSCEPSLGCQQHSSKLQFSPNLLSFPTKPPSCPLVSAGTCWPSSPECLVPRAVLERRRFQAGSSRRRKGRGCCPCVTTGLCSASVYPANCHPTLSPPGTEGHLVNSALPGTVWECSWQGGSSSLQNSTAEPTIKCNYCWFQE